MMAGLQNLGLLLKKQNRNYFYFIDVNDTDLVPRIQSKESSKGPSVVTTATDLEMASGKPI